MKSGASHSAIRHSHSARSLRHSPGRFFYALFGSVLPAVVPTVILFLLDVPLGQPGKLIYRYSELAGMRAGQIPPVLAIGIILGLGIGLAGSIRFQPRIIGIVVGLFGLMLLPVWNFWSPPSQWMVNAFNYKSMSHEGAFANEAVLVKSIPEYLRQFDHRVQDSKEKMGGTRVISNTPGTTVFLSWILRTFPANPAAPDWREEIFIDNYGAPPDAAAKMAWAVTAAMAMAALSVLAVIPAYGLGRCCFSPVGALVFTTAVTFNPCVVHFFPGKDPAQLLTVCVLLWAWFSGYRRGSIRRSFLAGALLPVGMAFGLIHLWIALAAALATLWDAAGDSERRKTMLLRNFLPAALGAMVLMLAVYLAIGWNMPLTFWRVQQRFRELQPELGFDTSLWLIIGAPLFLLFLGPMPWLMIWINARHFRRHHRNSFLKREGAGRHADLGRRVLLSTILIMAITYLTGVSYELPRLWVVFLPLLLLGLMIPRKVFHGRPPRRIVIAMMLVVMTQIICTGLHWSLLDAREAEYRLRSGRMFN